MNLSDTQLWAGTDGTLAAYMLGLKKMAEAAAPEKRSYRDDDDREDREPSLLRLEGDVGIVRISGALTNTDHWMNAYMGLTSYSDIREALVFAAKDVRIKSIVLDISSGGGAVHGVSDTGALISRIDNQVKPVRAFSDGAIMSAAYWLGASARSITLTKTAEAGSVGVILVHMEKSRMLKDAGITPTIIKAGKYKALGNPYNPLSPEDEAELQSQVDAAYQIFVEHIADRRSVSYAVADQRMGQGRVFMGSQALDAGLVDQVSSFDDFISQVQDSHREKLSTGIAFPKSPPQYGANSTQGTPVKNALTTQQIAAMAEGGSLTPVASAIAGLAAAPAAAAPAAAAPEAGAAEADPAQAPAAEASAAPAQEKASELVGYLQGQLAAAQASALDLTVQVRDLKAAQEITGKNLATMRLITASSVDRLRVALGHPEGGAEAMTDTELLASHVTLRGQFETKFRAGGVAAVSSSASPENEAKDAGASHLHLGRIKATRLK